MLGSIPNRYNFKSLPKVLFKGPQSCVDNDKIPITELTSIQLSVQIDVTGIADTLG